VNSIANKLTRVPVSQLHIAPGVPAIVVQVRRLAWILDVFPSLYPPHKRNF
jgi:hypothetical protein